MDAIEQLQAAGFQKAVTQLQAAGFDEHQATKIVEVMDEEINRIEKLDRKRFKQRWNTVLFQGLTIAAYSALMLLMIVGFFASVAWILSS